MTYIVIEIQKNADGTVGTLVNAYQTKNEAERQYHLVMAAAAVSTVPVHSCIMVTESGSPVRYDSYVHEQPEPEPKNTEESTE